MSQLNALAEGRAPEVGWQTLCRMSGVAALLAGALFRRSIAAGIGACFLPAAGLFWMLWQTAVAWKLCRNVWSDAGKRLASDLARSIRQLTSTAPSRRPYGDLGC